MVISIAWPGTLSHIHVRASRKPTGSLALALRHSHGDAGILSQFRVSARTSSGRQNQPQSGGIQQVSYHVLYPYYKLNNAPGSAPSNAKHSASHIRKTNRTFDDGSARLNANLDR